MGFFRKWRVWAVFLGIGFAVGVMQPLQAGTPHLVYGTLRLVNGSIPSGITFNAWILGRSGEVLTQASYDCGYSSGTWQVQCGNFATIWDAGEILHVAFSDGSGRTGSVEVTLTYDVSDNAGRTILVSPADATLLSTPDTVLYRGATVQIPVNVDVLTVPVDSVIAYQLTVAFDSDVLVALGAESEGAMTANWEDPVAAPMEAEMTVGGYTSGLPGTQMVADDGVLVYLTFLVQGIDSSETSGGTILRFQGAVFYTLSRTVTVSHTRNGRLTVQESPFAASRSVTLHSGWNLISFGIAPETNVVPDIFGSQPITYVFGYQSGQGPRTWSFGRPINDLEVMVGIHGYWVKSQASSIWHVNGVSIAVENPIPLHKGWNLIGYLPESYDAIGHSLQTLDTLYTYVMAYQGGSGYRTWSRNRPVNDLTILKPLDGYWIKMSHARTLVYPIGDYVVPRRIPESVVDSGTDDTTIVTPVWCDFWGFRSLVLFPGDTIRAFDPDGILCGKTRVLEGGSFLIHVFGDVPITSEVDEGAEYGDTIQFTVNGRSAFVPGGGVVWEDFGDIEVYLSDIIYCSFMGIESDELSAGDTLRVFDPGGVLCGETLVLEGGHFLILAAGDDPQTPGVDEGAVNGDIIRFVLKGKSLYVRGGNPVWETWGSREVRLASRIVCDFLGTQPDVLSEGDTLRAFDPDGVLCGETLVLEGGSFLIHAAGDDPQTSGVDEGAVGGDSIRFTLNGKNLFVRSGNPVWEAWGSREVQLAGYIVCDFRGVQPDIFAAGDILQAFDPDGVLCGEASVQAGGMYLIHTIGDDPQTTDVDEGAMNGDSIRFEANGDSMLVKSGNCVWEEWGNKEVRLAYPETGVNGSGSKTLPRGPALFQNFPNPFNGQTMIGFSVSAMEPVTVKIYDASGRLVRTLLDRVVYAPGNYTLTWDGRNDGNSLLSSGLYFCKVRIGGKEFARKMILMN